MGWGEPTPVTRVGQTAAGEALTIVPLEFTHWPWVASIYEAGIATGHATFETEVPRWEDFDAARLVDRRFVALERGPRSGRLGGGVADLGQAGLPRRGGALVYVDRNRRAAGSAAPCSTPGGLDRAGRHLDVQSGIFPENEASVALHHAAASPRSAYAAGWG